MITIFFLVNTFFNEKHNPHVCKQWCHRFIKVCRSYFRACVRWGCVMDCCCSPPAPVENKHYVSTLPPFLPLVQFQHLQSMLSETDPQLADVVRKQFPVWGTQQISVQHSSRLSLLFFFTSPKILPQVMLTTWISDGKTRQGFHSITSDKLNKIP